MDRAKVLDKIQKCMALGKSPNEHEAAAAMRQAAKLMERHGITERELGAIGYAHEKVTTAIQAGIKVPQALSHLIALMRQAFGVRAVINREIRVSDKNFSISYFGPEHRVILAGYAHVVVYRAVEKAWAEHLKNNPRLKGVVGVRAGFQLGWLESVRQKIQTFAMTPEEETGTDLVISETYGTLTKSKTSNMRVDGNAMRAGAQAGASFSLHTPMNGRESLKIAN